MKNFFIVFEGIDASGKTTQAALLRDYFLRRNFKAVLTSEPSSGPIGNLIREGMKRRVAFAEDEVAFDHQMAYLFAADRHDHLFNNVDGVFKLLNDGYIVICTRYIFSSLAYQGEGSDFEFVKQLNERFPNPDLTIFLDSPVDVSIDRMSRRLVVDRYETRERLVRVRTNYCEIFGQYKGVSLSLHGSAAISEVHASIVAFIEKGFAQQHENHRFD